MSSMYRNHITQNFILILSNHKRNQNMFSNSYFTIFIRSLKSRPFIFNSVKNQFFNKCSTSNISTTPTINNYTTCLVTYIASSMEDVLLLFLYIILFYLNIKWYFITKVSPSTRYLTSLQPSSGGISSFLDLSLLDLIFSCSLIIIIIVFGLCKVMSITKIPDILNITVMISFNFGFNLYNSGQIFFYNFK